MPLNDATATLPVAAEAPEKVDILVVDDLQEKLLVFETVLEELNQNLVFVRSGAEALREVLTREFAVILLDVNMPDIDGFETATLIRRYKRSAHTPIIFITAYADEMQTARGYSLGAVDYILSPVVPEVLRSKVRVFVELQVLQRRIARQADARVAHAAAEAALRVAEESTRRSAFLSELSHALSGLLDVRNGLHRLLRMVVPRLACGATVALVDAQWQVTHACAWHDTDASVTDYSPGELPVTDHDCIRRALSASAAGKPLEQLAFALRDGERLLGVLLLAGNPTPLGAAMLGDVAVRAAIAFAAAQLYQNLQEEIQERRRAEARLEEASKRKDEFLAMLSHELRNPLAPIGNAVEIIRRLGGHDSKLMWANDITDRQLRQLTRLVDELLDVARIGQGKIVLQTVPLELTALVGQCIEMMRPALAARQQMLTQSMPAQAVWIQADPARLLQVINNLLGNANKYTPDGGRVHVTVTVDGPQGRAGPARPPVGSEWPGETGSTQEHPQAAEVPPPPPEGVESSGRATLTQEQRVAVLSVRDNGIGIEPDLLPRVFDLFEQGKRALDRNQGGLGVGLTLVQRLVRLHDGRVEAHSAGAGHGAEFRVYLPCPQTAGSPVVSPRGGPPATASIPRRVLIVEDNADVADTTAAMLAMAGHTVRSARDGAQAIALAQEFAPEVVLLDVGLPLLDGYQVARRLRQLPQARDALLIGLTGYGLPADRKRGHDAGFDHHLLKPADPAELRALFECAKPSPRADNVAAEETDGSEPAPTATLYRFRRSS